MRMNKNTIILFSLVIIPLVIAVWRQFRPYPQEVTLTSQQEANVNELLNNMKTHCIGRYLIDLPESFFIYRKSRKLEDSGWVSYIGEPGDSKRIFIATKEMYPPAFEQFIQRREKIIKKERVINPLNEPFLKNIWALPNEMKGLIFERNESSGTTDSTRILEAYYYSKGVTVKLQKKTYNDSGLRFQKDRERRGGLTNYVFRDVGIMKDLTSRITGRPNDEIPTSPGSCITGAFIATDKTGKEQETMFSGFLSEKLKGIRINIKTDNHTREDDTILQRVEKLSDTISSTGAHVIRKGSFDINDLRAEEVLISGVQAPVRGKQYIFSLFINETSASYKQPGLKLDFVNDGDVVVTHSQEEIMAVWDAITHTIRLRPGAF